MSAAPALDEKCICTHSFGDHLTVEFPQGGPCLGPVRGRFGDVLCACEAFGAESELEAIVLDFCGDEDEAISLFQAFTAAGYRIVTVADKRPAICGLCGDVWSPRHSDQGVEHFPAQRKVGWLA